MTNEPHSDEEQRKRLLTELAFVHVVGADGNPVPAPPAEEPPVQPPRPAARSARVSDPAETPDRRSAGNQPTVAPPAGSLARPATAPPEPTVRYLPRTGLIGRSQLEDDSAEAEPDAEYPGGLPYGLGDDDVIDERSVHRLVSFGQSQSSVLIWLLKAAIVVVLWTVAVACLSGLVYAILRGMSVEELRPYLRQVREFFGAGGG